MREAHKPLPKKFTKTLEEACGKVSVFHAIGKKLPLWDGREIIVNSGSKDCGPRPNASKLSINTV